MNQAGMWLTRRRANAGCSVITQQPLNGLIGSKKHVQTVLVCDVCWIVECSGVVLASVLLTSYCACCVEWEWSLSSASFIGGRIGSSSGWKKNVIQPAATSTPPPTHHNTLQSIQRNTMSTVPLSSQSLILSTPILFSSSYGATVFLSLRYHRTYTVGSFLLALHTSLGCVIDLYWTI